MYFVGTVLKPTVAVGALVGHVLNSEERHLVVVKRSCLEVHRIGKQGLEHVTDLPVYGRITYAELWRPQGSAVDRIVLLLAKNQFCILGFEGGQPVTYASGDFANSLHRVSEVGQFGTLDPDGRALVLHMYDGLLMVVSLDSAAGSVQPASFDIRLEEELLLDMKFLHGCAQPTLCTLTLDSDRGPRVRTYVLRDRPRSVSDGPLLLDGPLDRTARMLLPVPAPLGGVLVVADQTIAYLGMDGVRFSVALPPTHVLSACRIDREGARFLLGDEYGVLRMVALRNGSLLVETLGTTTVASALCYVDNGVVFVGSACGDHQLVRLLQHANPQGSYVDVVQVYDNVGPIVDFEVVDLQCNGQGRVVACSGAYTEGSVRVIQSGVRVNEYASTELSGVRDVFCPSRNTLLLSYPASSVLLEAAGKDLRVVVPQCIRTHASTLYAGPFGARHWIQVCGNELCLYSVPEDSSHAMDCCAQWTAPHAITAVSSAAGYPYLAVASQGGQLSLFHWKGTSSFPPPPTSNSDGKSIHFFLETVGTHSFSSDIAAVDVRGSDGLVAVATWEEPGLSLFGPLATTPFDGSAPILQVPLGGLPRSVLLHALQGISYVFCGLADGQLVYAALEGSGGDGAVDIKRVALATGEVVLRAFAHRGDDESLVLACSDRPTVVYALPSRKLMFSAVTMDAVRRMADFPCDEFPSAMALLSHDSLVVGSVDAIQQLHVQKLPLPGLMPRRICHRLDEAVPSSSSSSSSTRTAGTFLLLADSWTKQAGRAEEVESGQVLLLDGASLEIRAVYRLNAGELGCSVTSCRFTGHGQAYYVVGTASTYAVEGDPQSGRLLVFAVDEMHKLRLVAAKDVPGAAVAVCEFGGRLLAGVNSQIFLYSLPSAGPSDVSFHVEAMHHAHTFVVHLATHGDTFVAGDLMRSVALYRYNPLEGEIEEVAHDPGPNWMTAVALVDGERALGADVGFNLMAFKWNPLAPVKEDAARLAVVGEFHVGDYINRLRHGSLVMRVADSAADSVLFATVGGSIGAVVPITQDAYETLSRLEAELRLRSRGLGGLDHAAWRAFHSHRRPSTSSTFGFVDGDFLERFLDLEAASKRAVADAASVSVDEASLLIESHLLSIR